MPDLSSLGINGNLQDHFSARRTDTLVYTRFIWVLKTKHDIVITWKLVQNLMRNMCLESH